MAKVNRGPAFLSPEVAGAANYKLDQTVPGARSDRIVVYDAIILDSGTRFGRTSSEKPIFLERAHGLRANGARLGKVRGAPASSSARHGGHETTLFAIITDLLHFGMTVIGLNDGFAVQMKVDEVTRGPPYGLTRRGRRATTSLPAPVIRCTPSWRPPRNSTAERCDQNAAGRPPRRPRNRADGCWKGGREGGRPWRHGTGRARAARQYLTNPLLASDSGHG